MLWRAHEIDEMQEEWKQYNDTNYFVSNFGKVYSVLSDKILKEDSSSRYQTVTIYHDGKKLTTRVHRMVGEMFLKKNFDSLEINHIDGNKLNNRVDNLEWVTSLENLQHALDTGLRIPLKGVDHHNAKLDEFKVLEIKRLLESNKYSQQEIADLYGITQGPISDINKGIAWSHVTNWTPQERATKVLSEDVVLKIKQYLDEKTLTIKQIANLLSIDPNLISKINKGVQYSHITGWNPESRKDVDGRYYKFITKLTAEDIPKIRAMFVEGYSNKQIAKIYGLHDGTISAIRLGKNWKNY